MARWVEYFIARRTSQSSAKGDGTVENHTPEGAMMTRVATIAVALSVAVMILSLAIIFGFQSAVHSRLTALSGDVIIASTRGVNTAATHSIMRNDSIESIARGVAKRYGTQLRRINPYATRATIVRRGEGVEGILLKGVDSTLSMEMFDRGLFEGEIPNFGGEKSSRNTIVSKELASELGLEVGGRLELLMADDDGSLRRDLYRIAAIYTAGGGAAEKGVVLTDIRNVQRLNGWGESQISGYEISLSNRDKSVEIADQINIEILYNENEELDQSAAYAIERLYPSIFDWLAALDMNGVVIISIMMVVAIFNIITALLILVLERVQMIGVLKALGMNNSSLRQVFLLRALSITFWGLIWGNGVGIALSLLQRHFEVVKLDETGYLLDTVPIELGVGWITLLNIGVIVAIIIVVSVPTRIVGSIEPHKAIKFQ